MHFHRMDEVLLCTRLTGSGSPTALSLNTTPSGTTSEWRSNLDGFHLSRSILFACFSRFGANAAERSKHGTEVYSAILLIECGISPNPTQNSAGLCGIFL